MRVGANGRSPDKKQMERRESRENDTQWQLADRIRARLLELGITLEDTPQGTVWKYKR